MLQDLPSCGTVLIKKKNILWNYKVPVFFCLHITSEIFTFFMQIYADSSGSAHRQIPYVLTKFFSFRKFIYREPSKVDNTTGEVPADAFQLKILQTSQSEEENEQCHLYLVERQ